MAIKLRTTLMASMGAIVLGSAATGWVSWYTRDMLAGHLLTTQTIILPNTVDLREASRAGIQLQAAARGIVLLPEDGQAKENLSRTLDEFPRLLERVIAKSRRKEVREDLKILLNDWKSHVVPAVQRLQAAVDRGDIEQARQIVLRELNPAWRDIKARLEKRIVWREKANDEEFEKYRRTADFWSTLVTVSSMVLVIFALVLGIMMDRMLRRRLAEAEEAVGAVVDRRDLTAVLPPASDDELGRIIAAIGRLRDAIRELVLAQRAVLARVRSAAEEQSTDAAEARRAAALAAENAEKMAAAIEELSANIDRLNEMAHLADERAVQSQQRSLAGVAIIERTAHQMRDIVEITQRAGTSVSALIEQAQHISSIAQTIQEIADQTNLLALNAAIEAARAGEYGRGFAVVADEVRKLAERTAASTREIREIIDQVQQQSNDASAQMAQVRERVEEGETLAASVEGELRAISSAIDAAREAVSSMSHAIEEQAKAAQLLAQQVEQAAQAADGAAERASDSEEKAKLLLEVARQAEEGLQQSFRA